MYPRNATSPQRIAIGPVISTSDGSVQTSGVTVRVLPQGGTESDGLGTVGYTTDGVVTYAPTQAETNYESFILVARKDGCYPAVVTVVTSAESVSGKVSLGASQTADITGNLYGSVNSVVGDVGGNLHGNVQGDVVGSVAAVLGDVQGNVVGNVEGNVSGKVLGGGTGTISGVGARVVDQDGDAVAKQSTLLGQVSQGARTVTITVTDGSSPIESARVRLTKGVESYVATTNASGQAVLHVDDGTWSVVVTKGGYSWATASLVVDGDESVSLVLMPTTIPPSEPGQVTGYTYCYDVDGTPEKDATVYLRMTTPPPGVGAFDGSVYSQASDAAGLVAFTGLFPGATYRVWRGQRGAILVTIPAGASQYGLPAFVGT